VSTPHAGLEPVSAGGHHDPLCIDTYDTDLAAPYIHRTRTKETYRIGLRHRVKEITEERPQPIELLIKYITLASF
jgi:hypothetical protein